MRNVVGLVIAFCLMAAVFWVIERLWPGVPGQKWRRKGVGTDLIYWLFTPLVTKWIVRAALIVTAVVVIWAMGWTPTSFPRHGFGPVAAQAPWLQAIEIIALGDLIGYWMHRAFHGGRLWPFHAIHHSPAEVDWMSAVRLHPVNDVLTKLVQSLPFLFLGFSPLVLVAYIPLLTFYSILLHANVSWTFGPFKYVLASPVFHRWHHTKESEAQNKNFAGMLPIWDILFGTFYMPPGKLPRDFGVTEPVPEGIMGQLAYPFQSPPRRLEPAASSI